MAIGNIKKGQLHRDMGVPQGQKIGKAAIEAKKQRDMASGNTTGVKRDTFALNFGYSDGGRVMPGWPHVSKAAKMPR